MARQCVSESLDQAVGTIVNKLLRFRADGGVVDGARDVIFQLRRGTWAKT